jgi:hypothetical protein
MKNKILLFIGVAVMLMSCHKDTLPPPSHQHTTSTACNSVETSLLGKWFVKQTSMYHADTLMPFSVANYSNAQQYVQFNSDLDNAAQATWPNAKLSTWSPMGSAQQVNWTAANCSINAPASSPTYRITYISTDSLVLDYGFTADSSQFNRYSLHK